MSRFEIKVFDIIIQGELRKFGFDSCYMNFDIEFEITIYNMDCSCSENKGIHMK